MRKLFLLLTMFLCVHLHAQEHVALLMVHFGTSYDETRLKTIDAINEKARQAFPDMEVREAYTSDVIVNRLKKRGVVKDSPVEALLRLRTDGFTHILIQPTFIIDGVEMDTLLNDVQSMRRFFTDLRIGTPLLYEVEDAQKVVDILARRHSASNKKREHVVLVGHGTSTPATAIYSEIDYMAKAIGHTNMHCATIEGYPTRQDAIRMLRTGKAKKVTLVPFLFVAGNHVANDISKEWKTEMEQQGFATDVFLEGLGEVPEIQQLYIQKIGKLKR